jgi:hypothetical protein
MLRGRYGLVLVPIRHLRRLCRQQRLLLMLLSNIMIRPTRKHHKEISIPLRSSTVDLFLIRPTRIVIKKERITGSDCCMKADLLNRGRNKVLSFFFVVDGEQVGNMHPQPAHHHKRREPQTIYGSPIAIVY